MLFTILKTSPAVSFILLIWRGNVFDIDNKASVDDWKSLSINRRRLFCIFSILFVFVTLQKCQNWNLRHTVRAITRVPLLLTTRAWVPTLATKYHRGGKSTWSDRDSNPGLLAYPANTQTTELPSHTVDLWQWRIICGKIESSQMLGKLTWRFVIFAQGANSL